MASALITVAPSSKGIELPVLLCIASPRSSSSVAKPRHVSNGAVSSSTVVMHSSE